MMKNCTRLKVVAVITLALLFVTALTSPGARAQVTLLDAETHPKFVNPLPVIKDLGLRIDLTDGTPRRIEVEMRQIDHWDLGLQVPGGYNGTKVWGYKFPGLPTTYPGATIVAMRDKRVVIKWSNKLPKHFLPVDPSLHMAHPMGQDAVTWYEAGNVAAVTHLHGGHTESASDGLPEAWFSQDFNETGAYFIKKDYRYDNTQEAATLWYHDHALGITRLNTYAGLAGFYLLRDENENNLINNGVLPSGDYEIEVVVQDRMFTDDGQLFFPSKTGDPWFGDPDEPLALPRDPSVVAEFFGNFILVNGKAWPKLDVEQTKYRFRFLNGSDSRVYNFAIQDQGGTVIPFMQIGTDDGLLPHPVFLTDLVLAPGERADLVVDFSEKTGSFTVVNTGPDEPFKGGNFNSDITRPTGQIMRFDVDETGTPPEFDVSLSSSLRPPIVPLIQTGATRKLALFEGEDAIGRLQPLLGVINGDNPKPENPTFDELNGSLAWFEPITENPGLNDVEVWEVYNATEDAHPIHLHLVSFQILGRTPFTSMVSTQDQIQHDGEEGVGAYIKETSIEFTGTEVAPAANERGWKDTFVVPPGYRGRLIAKFDRPGRYVWHCHILSHEDHEMMRPYQVGPMPQKGGKKSAAVEDQVVPDQFGEFRLYPNPASELITVDLMLEEGAEISISIYGFDGRMINSEKLGHLNEGIQTIAVPVDHLENGMYILELKAGSKQFRESIIISK